MLREIRAALAAQPGAADANACVVCWHELQSGPRESWRTVVTEDNFDAVLLLLGREVEGGRSAGTVVEICTL